MAILCQTVVFDTRNSFS